MIYHKAGYYLLRRKKDFDASKLKDIYYRLIMLLGIEAKEFPIFSFKRLSKEDDGYAHYDNNTNMIVFDNVAYNLKKTDVLDKQRVLLDLRDTDLSDIHYVLPLPDIYHELIHKIQYDCDTEFYLDVITDMTSFIEGSAELYTYLCTNLLSIEYIEESVALWNFLTTCTTTDFEMYSAIRGLIVRPREVFNLVLGSPQAMRDMTDYYNGHLPTFIENIVEDYYMSYTKEQREQMQRNMIVQLSRINKLLFNNTKE